MKPKTLVVDLLDYTALNWMMKCDRRWEDINKFILNVYILCSKMSTNSHSVDPTSGFEHL